MCMGTTSTSIADCGGLLQDVAPPDRRSFGRLLPRCGKRSPGPRAQTRLEGTPHLGCRRPPWSIVYPGGGRSYGRGRSRPSARSSND